MIIRGENGNAIFIILIAIALFAALSMAISYSGQSGGSISNEQARVEASDIIDYSNILATAVSRLRLDGCRPEEISFENNIAVGYINATSPSNNTCHVFDNNAGGAKYRKDYPIIFTGSYIVENVGTSGTDLIMNIDVNKSICEGINNLLDIPNTGLEGPPSDTLSDGVLFQGDYTIATTAAANQRIDHADLIGKNAGCRTNSGSGASAVFSYYKVLLAR